MSLNWDTTEMEKRLGKAKYDEVTTSLWKGDDGEDQWNPVTEALVWSLFAIGIRDITEKNADEVFSRISILETVGEPQLLYADDAGKPVRVFITKQDVDNHIGLSTNVTTKAKGLFNALVVDRALNTARRRGEMISAHDMLKARYAAQKEKKAAAEAKA